MYRGQIFKLAQFQQNWAQINQSALYGQLGSPLAHILLDFLDRQIITSLNHLDELITWSSCSLKLNQIENLTPVQIKVNWLIIFTSISERIPCNWILDHYDPLDEFDIDYK